MVNCPESVDSQPCCIVRLVESSIKCNVASCTWLNASRAAFITFQSGRYKDIACRLEEKIPSLLKFRRAVLRLRLSCRNYFWTMISPCSMAKLASSPFAHSSHARAISSRPSSVPRSNFKALSRKEPPLS